MSPVISLSFERRAWGELTRPEPELGLSGMQPRSPFFDSFPNAEQQSYGEFRQPAPQRAIHPRSQFVDFLPSFDEQNCGERRAMEPRYVHLHGMQGPVRSPVRVLEQQQQHQQTSPSPPTQFIPEPRFSSRSGSGSDREETAWSSYNSNDARGHWHGSDSGITAYNSNEAGSQPRGRMQAPWGAPGTTGSRSESVQTPTAMAPDTTSVPTPKFCPGSPVSLSEEERHDTPPPQIQHLHPSDNPNAHLPPMLLWCWEKPTKEQEDHVWKIAEHYRYARFLKFPTTSKFTHWLMRQHRGIIRPWAVLVTSWRNRNLVMTAMQAARTGDMSLLPRMDCRKPSARPVLAFEGQGMPDLVQIAIAELVIVRGSSLQKQDQQVYKWADDAMESFPGLRVHVARNEQELDIVTSGILQQWRVEKMEATAATPRSYSL